MHGKLVMEWKHLRAHSVSKQLKKEPGNDADKRFILAHLTSDLASCATPETSRDPRRSRAAHPLEGVVGK